MIDEKKLIEDIIPVLKKLSADDAREVMEVIKSQHKVGEWIPCSERLPEYAYWRDICVTMKMYDTFITRKVNWNGEEGRWEWGNGKPVKEQVIAWMPSPEPYREEKKDE